MQDSWVQIEIRRGEPEIRSIDVLSDFCRFAVVSESCRRKNGKNYDPAGGTVITQPWVQKKLSGRMRDGRCHWKRSIWENIDFTQAYIMGWPCLTCRHFRTTFTPLPYCFSFLQKSFRNNIFFLFRLHLLPWCPLARYIFQTTGFYFAISFSLHQSIAQPSAHLFFLQ